MATRVAITLKDGKVSRVMADDPRAVVVLIEEERPNGYWPWEARPRTGRRVRNELGTLDMEAARLCVPPDALHLRDARRLAR